MTIGDILALYEQGRIDSQEMVDEGIAAMFARGGAPDTIKAEMTAYHAEVSAATRDWTAEDYAAAFDY